MSPVTARTRRRMMIAAQSLQSLSRAPGALLPDEAAPAATTPDDPAGVKTYQQAPQSEPFGERSFGDRAFSAPRPAHPARAQR